MSWFGHNHMPVEGRTILLTGGSEGTGLSAARIFSSKGANVVIVSRDSAKLEKAVKSIAAAAKSPETQRFYTIAADVSKSNYAEGVVADATAWNNGQPPEIVWCLAGLSTPMLWMDDGAMEASRYNRTAAALDQGQQQRSTREPRPAAKHIIFTGSVLSTFSLAGHAPYCPSKFAVRALADALAMEARLYPDVPIDVHLVLPNSVNTAGYEHENETKPEITVQLEGRDVVQDPDDVARLAIAGVERGRYFIATTFVGDLMRWGAMGNSPRNNWFVDTLMGWIMPTILAYVMWDMNTQVSSWGKKKKQV
ncbi:3-ketodihydrosphingosine reductase tsc-10 [Nemania abortiva]|nr:3-ketodihydrosphingosine reductase tsc-10 [Nemania abortiva]